MSEKTIETLTNLGYAAAVLVCGRPGPFFSASFIPFPPQNPTAPQADACRAGFCFIGKGPVPGGKIYRRRIPSR